jgi:O-antigen ligase
VVAGIIVGFWSAPQLLSGQVTGTVAVAFFSWFNLLFLVAQSRVAKRPAEARSNVYKEAWCAIAKRPLISVLVLLQLWGVARCLGSVMTLGRAYSNPETVSQDLQGRVLLVCALLAIVGLLWLAGAAAIWKTRTWSWWLALALNGLAAGTTMLIQMFKRDEFLIDPVAVLMFVLLILPVTRRQFKTQPGMIGGT